MTRPAVFFDRDNTLIVNDGYLGSPAGVVLVEGAADAVARVRDMRFATVVFSNQSGVARGFFNEATVHAVNARLDEVLADHHPRAIIDRHEFCPFHPDGVVDGYREDSDLRKPRPGMLIQAAAKLDLDLSRSWVIGDAARDIEAGHAAGCQTILVRDEKLPPSPAATEESAVTPDFTVNSLRQAIDVIETRQPAPAEDEAPSSESAAPQLISPQPVSEPEPEPPRAIDASASAESGSPSPPEVPSSAAATAQDRSAAPIPTANAATARIEAIAQEILDEMMRVRTKPTDFSISKLAAGIVQILALAAVFLAYVNRFTLLDQYLYLAIFLQIFTVALLIMEKQQ